MALKKAVISHLQAGRDRYVGVTGSRFQSQWRRREGGQVRGKPVENNQTSCREETEDIDTEGFGNDDMVGIVGRRHYSQIQGPLNWKDKP